MIFTLEALQAHQGDSLVLHYGSPDAPRFIVIDGGPASIYANSLRPRLEQIHHKWKRASDGKLPVQMLMISHIDDDHIHGVIDWVKEIEDNSAVPCSIRTCWFNSFDRILDNDAEEIAVRAASLGDNSPGTGHLRALPQAMAVIASVKQGRELRERIEALGIDINSGGGLLMVDEADTSPFRFPGDLTVHVAGPSLQRLKALQKDWADHVRDHPEPVVTAAFLDRTVPNLSSIVAVAEFDGKTMLLTGDARGDDVRAGLKMLGFLDDHGRAHFHLIKMPHHGSNRNMDLQWLKDITADHYVISASGMYSNPDADTVKWICKARQGHAYSLYLTNQEMTDPKTGVDIGKAVADVLAAHPNSKRKVVFRKDAELSVKAELSDNITY